MTKTLPYALLIALTIAGCGGGSISHAPRSAVVTGYSPMQVRAAIVAEAGSSGDRVVSQSDSLVLVHATTHDAEMKPVEIDLQFQLTPQAADTKLVVTSSWNDKLAGTVNEGWIQTVGKRMGKTFSY